MQSTKKIDSGLFVVLLFNYPISGFSDLRTSPAFELEVTQSPINVINPFTMMSSLPKTYPPKIDFDSAFKK
jgi:hypothetical protein